MIKEYFFIFLMVIFTVAGQFCIKKGASKLQLNEGLIAGIRSLFSGFLLAGFLLVMCAPVFYIFALKTIELSRAFAFSSANYIFVVLGSRFLFDEQINMLRWTGVFMIASGITMFGIS